MPDLNDENIDDEWDMSETLSSMFEDFLLELEKEEGMIRPVRDGDWSDDPKPLFMWTRKAQKLIDEELANLRRLGEKYFPGEVTIDSYMYREE